MDETINLLIEVGDLLDEVGDLGSLNLQSNVLWRVHCGLGKFNYFCSSYSRLYLGLLCLNWALEIFEYLVITNMQATSFFNLR